MPVEILTGIIDFSVKCNKNVKCEERGKYMSKVLKNLYLTPSQVAGGVSEFQKSQLTGEDISRKFRRILETIEKEVEGAQLNCLYKSKSRRNNEVGKSR